MLAKRIIPCLDINNGRVVKGVHFKALRDAGDPVRNALFYNAQGADELVFLDITATVEKRKIILDLVKRVASTIFITFTVGGGISDVKQIREILLAGADKVSINTSALKRPNLIKEASGVFGSQCVVLAVDAKRIAENKWEVYINGGRTPTGVNAIEWIKKAQRLGAGEVLLTSIDYDGTKDGYDLELIKNVSKAVSIPVIASGGAGTRKHFFEVFKSGAQAALAASVFHYKTYSIKDIKTYLRRKGIPIRF